ncbi:MAG: flavin reductase family protein [Rhodobacteraceae bacterium]|nr:flavin reductase family protein [Paracoccaceae bacterium]
MFYEPRLGHPLPHNPFKAIVSPRPIGWISTVDIDGNANLAPYSFFNAVADTPPMVMFSSSGNKDSLSNIRATGEFVVNVVSDSLKDQMNITSGAVPSNIDEFDLAGLKKADCRLVRAPRVAAAPAALECKVFQIIELVPNTSIMVIGEVVGVHLDDRAIVNGIFDVTLFNPLARLGYKDYTSVQKVFSLNRPEQE